MYFKIKDNGNKILYNKERGEMIELSKGIFNLARMSSYGRGCELFF